MRLQAELRGEPEAWVRVLPASSAGRREGAGGGERAGEPRVLSRRDQAAGRDVAGPARAVLSEVVRQRAAPVGVRGRNLLSQLVPAIRRNAEFRDKEALLPGRARGAVPAVQRVSVGQAEQHPRFTARAVRAFRPRDGRLDV